jgi:hypothetical protein
MDITTLSATYRYTTGGAVKVINGEIHDRLTAGLGNAMVVGQIPYENEASQHLLERTSGGPHGG